MDKENIKSLFLNQSYIDCYAEYEKSIRNDDYVVWDFVVITASNDEQRDNYIAQINNRLSKNSLCARTKYLVIADPDGKRVGSGGATLNVLAALNTEYGISDFAKYKILLIHSGGDSKRIPQFSACGKLFSPVPRMLNNGSPSTIFDEFIIATASIPSRMKGGMLVMSGDVLLLFNPLQIDFDGVGAGALTIKADVNVGKNHGVFLCDNNGEVIEFLHKKSVEELTKKGAVANNKVDIDTGAVIFGGKLINALFALISDGARLSPRKIETFINERVRLSFYGDFLFLLAKNVTKEKFLQEDSEGERGEELDRCRDAIWDNLSPFKMSAIKLQPSEFIHFGTSREYLQLCAKDIVNYKYLDWSSKVATNIEKGEFSAYNSVIEECVIGANSFVENSEITACNIGANTIITNVKMNGKTIPSDIVLNTLTMKSGEVVTRIYGIDDNPKVALASSYFGRNIANILSEYHIDDKVLFDGDDKSLWQARLFPVCPNQESSVDMAIEIHDIFLGKATRQRVAAWLKMPRESLASSYVHADVKSQIAKNNGIMQSVIARKAIDIIVENSSLEKFFALFDKTPLNDALIRELLDFAANTNINNSIRINHYLGKLIERKNYKYDIELNKSYEIIKTALLKSSISKNRSYKFAKKEYSCDLAVRVNFGGGWTDTPPYCIDNGGTVLNAAIILNGEKPIKIVAKATKKPCIKFECLDSRVSQEFFSTNDIVACNDPFDQFALHKACLVALGVIKKGDILGDALAKLGGGIYLSTDVQGIPRGSGLGTSSILAAGCAKAMLEIFGVEYTDNDIYDTVLLMEQIMSTGGGWQDQVGGLTDGMKFITSSVGLEQKLRVERVELSENAKVELNERFALIYTGQRRLARNLLRNVMGNYIERLPKSVLALKEMERLACVMKRELERGDIDEFARLLNAHWECSKALDEGTTNTCIEHIFKTIDDLIDGKMICGAGGGGFVQVILKSGVTKEDMSERLVEAFGESGVSVWNSEIIFD